MKIQRIIKIILLMSLAQVNITAQKMNLVTFTASGNNYEPSSYNHDFFAPVYSDLLCKNNAQKTIPIANISNPIESNVYVGTAINSNGTVEPNKTVHFLSSDPTSFVELKPGFEASSGSVFAAVLKDECPTETQYEPAFRNRYLISVFAPRMKTGGGNIRQAFDFHQGADIIDRKYPKPSEGDISPNIHCMCDGIVYKIFDEAQAISEEGKNLEETARGRSLTIKCNDTFNVTGWGNIYLAFRHLENFVPTDIKKNDPVVKGQVIGVMGESGITTNIHLHLSVQRKEGGKLYNVHPDRVFNTEYNPHLIKKLDANKAEIQLLDYKEGSSAKFNSACIPGSGQEVGEWALIRVAVPYNQTSLRLVTIKVDGTSYEKTYDYESLSKDISDHGETAESYDWINDLKLYVFPFNRAYSTYAFFNPAKDYSVETSIELLDFHTGTSSCYPITDSGIYKEVTYVFDVLANNLPSNFDPKDIRVEVVDIWGNGIRGQLP